MTLSASKSQHLMLEKFQAQQEIVKPATSRSARPV